jgi:hypothetical protein
MQDLIAIAVSVTAALWLMRSLSQRFFAPPCRPPAAPDAADGFVPLDQLTGPGPPTK